MPEPEPSLSSGFDGELDLFPMMICKADVATPADGLLYGTQSGRSRAGRVGDAVLVFSRIADVTRRENWGPPLTLSLLPSLLPPLRPPCDSFLWYGTTIHKDER